ncbi:uncharacterized protein BX663DRAFT_469294 [Cokeromyces recurvatus]|uniref:uncharacterized protein n=1 Tax=Cokeromyces recurvatus TaxID=90255 RepID=UPI00222018A5|nr:uncharacterized protein BX663DRAFT_469294 [Cokeromyces recurvatus]KAI7905353.1 hypothetical protein BX663DRAFT_469294 [Cokeromyces recurvatus]
MHQIFGGRPFTSNKVILHLTNLPNIKDRISIFQVQFLFRSSFLPNDALLTKLLSYIHRLSQTKPKWSQLSKSPLWISVCNENLNTTSDKDFSRKRKGFLLDNYHSKLQKHSKLLSHCRNNLIVDPILTIPMTRSERFRCVRWRLGWLPLGKPKACPFHPNELFTRSHSFSCLHMHNRLQIPQIY